MVLTEQRKKELKNLLRPGNQITAVLSKLRATRDPGYELTCEFVLSQLDKAYGVPAGKHGIHYLDSDRDGWRIVFGGYDARGYILEIGVDVKHPSPLPITSRVTVTDVSSLLPPSKRMSVLAKLRMPDFKMASAADRS